MEVEAWEDVLKSREVEAKSSTEGEEDEKANAAEPPLKRGRRD